MNEVDTVDTLQASFSYDSIGGTSTDENTPIPSPSPSQVHDMESSQKTSLQHSDSQQVQYLKPTSVQESSVIRPSLLQRAQLFLQKQLDVLTSSSSSDTESTKNSQTTSLWTTNPTQYESKFTTVTRTENQSPVTSLSVDTSSISSDIKESTFNNSRYVSENLGSFSSEKQPRVKPVDSRDSFYRKMEPRQTMYQLSPSQQGFFPFQDFMLYYFICSVFLIQNI